MAWMETDPVSESVRFISAWPSREESVSALAIRVGGSRKPRAGVRIKRSASDRHRPAETSAAGLGGASSPPHASGQASAARIRR